MLNSIIEVMKNLSKKLLNDKPVLLLLILSVFGLFLSLFLAYEYSQPRPVTCLQASDDCESVRNSEYAVLLGVSVPFWGVLYFMFVAVYLLAIKGLDLHEKHHYSLIIPMSLAFIFESYLTYVQFVIINAICTWCLIVEAIVTIMFIIYLVTLNKPQSSNEQNTDEAEIAPAPSNISSNI